MFFCLNICFTFTNSVDQNEMQNYVAFHLGLHCLQKDSFRGFPKYKGLKPNYPNKYLIFGLYMNVGWFIPLFISDASMHTLTISED